MRLKRRAKEHLTTRKKEGWWKRCTDSLWKIEIGVRGRDWMRWRINGDESDRVKMSKRIQRGGERELSHSHHSERCSSGGRGYLCHHDGSLLSVYLSPTTPLQHITDVHTHDDTHTHAHTHIRTHIRAQLAAMHWERQSNCKIHSHTNTKMLRQWLHITHTET